MARGSTAMARGSGIGDISHGRREFDTVAYMSISSVPKPCRYDILSLGVGTTLSELAASDEIGGPLSCSDSLEKVLLGLYRSEPLTRGEARLLNVTRWESVSLLVVYLKNCRIVHSDHNLVIITWWPWSTGAQCRRANVTKPP